MKRSLLIAAGLLFSLLANSQVVFVPRIEASAFLPKDGVENTLDFGDSAFYTYVDGELGDHFSYSFSGLFLNSDPKSLYTNNFRSDTPNWLSWANVTYSTRKFDFTLGKDYLRLGGFETEAYDYELFYPISSNYWNNVNTYQWGGSVAYRMLFNTSTLRFQVTSSPFGERTFESGLNAYILNWQSEFGIFSFNTSLGKLEYESQQYKTAFSFGSKVTLGKHYTVLDLMWIGKDASYKLSHGREFKNVAVEAKVGYEKYDGCGFFGGLIFKYYPIKDNKDFSIHMMGAYNKEYDGVFATLGLLYTIEL